MAEIHPRKGITYNRLYDVHFYKKTTISFIYSKISHVNDYVCNICRIAGCWRVGERDNMDCVVLYL